MKNKKLSSQIKSQTDLLNEMRADFQLQISALEKKIPAIEKNKSSSFDIRTEPQFGSDSAVDGDVVIVDDDSQSQDGSTEEISSNTIKSDTLNRNVGNISTSKSATVIGGISSDKIDVRSTSPKAVNRNTADEWTTVTKRVKRVRGAAANESAGKTAIKRAGVVGTGKSQFGVQTAPKKAFIYVTRFAPGTTPESVKSVISPLCPEVECEAVTSKHPQCYSSFKLCVNDCNRTVAMEPSNWPQGVFINSFFRSRGRGGTDRSGEQ